MWIIYFLMVRMDNNSKFCRFCLYEEQPDSNNLLLDIFKTQIQNDLKNLGSILINHEDNIPPLVCGNCLDFIKQILEFLEKVQHSKKVLYKRYNNKDEKEDLDKIEVIKTIVSPSQSNTDLQCCMKENNTKSKIDASKSEINNIKSKANTDKNKSRRKCRSVTKSCIEPNQKRYINVRQNNGSHYELCKAEIIDNEINREKEISDAIYFPGGHNINLYKKQVNNIISVPGISAKLTQLKSTENTNYVYSCSICSEQFDNFFGYQDHQQSHNGQFVFCCSKCNEVFSSRTDLVIHESKHKVACTVCNIQVLPKNLSAHMKKHTDLFKCADCHSRHSSRALLENHFKARHAGIKGYVCHICGKQNSCQASMNRHLATHLSVKPFKCKMCSFATKSKNILQVHVLRKHSNQMMDCDICTKTFKSELSLNQHKKRMHQPKKHSCKHCGKNFVEKYNLDQHLRKRHSIQRVFACKICHEDFLSSQKLKDHMHSHRSGCVSCENCGKTFFYKKHWLKHVEKCGSSLVSRIIQKLKE